MSLSALPPSRSESVERFLATGEVDRTFPAWGGDGAKAEAAYTRVLRRIVGWRADNAPLRPRQAPKTAAKRVRKRVSLLVDELFPRAKAPALVEALAGRVEVMTVDRFVEGRDALPVEDLWSLANVLLDELGAPPVSSDAPQLDGICAAGRAWVTPGAFRRRHDGSDVVLHEVAHLLHEVRRGEVGMAPADAPLVPVPVHRRETWAYACEIWASARSAPDDASRAVVVAAADPGRSHEDARVDPSDLRAALAAAVAAPERGFAALRDVLTRA